MRISRDKKILYMVPAVFLVILIFKVTVSYLQLQEHIENFVIKEGEILTSYIKVYRSYYQKLFIKGVINLNEKTVKALPAYAISSISDELSSYNSFGIKIKVASDRARNPKNRADKSDMKAINYFKTHKDKKIYISKDDKEFYQYSQALRIEKSCLVCHSSPKNAPKFIREHYDNAYGYKLGELRGVISLKIPKKSLKHYFLKNFYYSILFDILLYLALFVMSFYVIRKIDKINTILEDEVSKISMDLKNSILFDKLTELPNRTSLIRDLNKFNNEKNQIRYLTILDIDDFKDVNDYYGYFIGDKILMEVSKLLISFTRKNGFISVYKLSSDEYAILSDFEVKFEKYIDIIKRIIESVQNKRFRVDNHSIYIRVSCGVAEGVENLIVKADMALKEAKNKNKSLVIFNENLERVQFVNEKIITVNILKQAFEKGAVVPFFQPIYDLHTEKIDKYEALARIVLHGQIITPDKFLDIAKKAKMYFPIMQSIITKSFKTFENSNNEFSINLSINDITDEKMKEFIIEKLKSYEGSNRVVFEILEEEEIRDYDELNLFISKVKKYGCKVAIDDFGSGYSNFSHIMALNIDYLKIDASLIKNILTDENSYKTIKTIVYFAKSMKIKTIAEYVVNYESMEKLKSMGVDYVQGNYIGKPKPLI